MPENYDHYILTLLRLIESQESYHEAYILFTLHPLSSKNTGNSFGWLTSV